MSVSCPVRECTQRRGHTCPSPIETDPGHGSSVAGTHRLQLIVARRHNDARVKHLQREGQSYHKGRGEPRLLPVAGQHPVLQYPSRDGRRGTWRARCGKGNAVLRWDAVFNFGKMRKQTTAKQASRAPTVSPVGGSGAQLCPSSNHQSANAVVPHSASVMRCFPLGVSLWDFIPFWVKAHVPPDLICSLSLSFSYV